MISTPAIRTYLRDIADIPLLTADDEIALAERIALGCAAARDLMIRSNLLLVVKMAGAYNVPTMDMSDLVNEGNIGLMKAAERFDPKRGVRFFHCAEVFVREAITRAIANQSRTIRMPLVLSRRIVGARMVPLDEPCADSGECLGIADENSPDLARGADMHDRISQLKTALRELSERERHVLLKRYDLPLTYADT